MKKAIIALVIIAVIIAVYFLTRKPKAISEEEILAQQVQAKADEIKTAATQAGVTVTNEALQTAATLVNDGTLTTTDALQAIEAAVSAGRTGAVKTN